MPRTRSRSAWASRRALAGSASDFVGRLGVPGVGPRLQGLRGGHSIISG